MTFRCVTLASATAQLVVQFYVFVVFTVAAVSPCLGRSERPLRDPLYQFPSFMLRIDLLQPCGDLSRKASKGCVA